MQDILLWDHIFLYQWINTGCLIFHIQFWFTITVIWLRFFESHFSNISKELYFEGYLVNQLQNEKPINFDITHITIWLSLMLNPVKSWLEFKSSNPYYFVSVICCIHMCARRLWHSYRGNSRIMTPLYSNSREGDGGVGIYKISPRLHFYNTNPHIFKILNPIFNEKSFCLPHIKT